MAAYRQVMLPVRELRAGDIIVVEQNEYQVLIFQTASEITSTSSASIARLDTSAKGVLHCERYDMQKEKAIAKPIRVLVGPQHILPVLLEVPERIGLPSDSST